MKLKAALLATGAILLSAYAGFAGGTITNIIAWADGDGAILCPNYAWPNTASAGIYGDQFSGPGHILFDVATDIQQDPTLTLNNVIDNDTGFAWSGYRVNIFMNKPFSIPSLSLNALPGWSLLSYTPSATFNGTEWFGQIDFSGTPAIAPLSQIDFTYQLSFVGSVHFTEELIPIAVPEPASCSLLLAGGLLLGLIRRQRQ